MKTLIFILSMPNVGSWNHKWTGAENLYARKRKVKDDLAKLIMADAKSYPIYEGAFAPKLVGHTPPKTYYGYDFGDGWRASIEIQVLPAKEVNKIVKKSKGFYGYDWMIDSILTHQEIKWS